MARITVEDCLRKADNRFSLVHLAARRVRQLKKGDPPRIQCKNREIVTALREIAAGVITIETLKEIDEHLSRRYEAPVLAPPVQPEAEPAQPESVTEEETAASADAPPEETPPAEEADNAGEVPTEAGEDTAPEVEAEHKEETKEEEEETAAEEG